MASEDEAWTMHPILEAEDKPADSLWYAIAAEGHPNARMGHSCTTVDGSAVLFGGATPEGPYDDTAAFDMRKLAWVGSTTQADGPSARYEHVAIQVPGKKEICVFAGANAEGNLNDVHVYDVGSGKWRAVATTGTPPSERTARVAAAVGAKIFIFGGGSLGNVPVDDSSVHVLDTATWAWSQPATTGAAPMCRQGHSMTAVGDKVFVFAGSAGTSIFNDLWCLDTGSMTWSEVEENGGSPPARTAHAAAAIGTCLFVSGGLSLDRASGAPEALGDLWCFDTATQTWTLPKLGTAPFNPRLGHTMCAVPVFALQGDAGPKDEGPAGAESSQKKGGAADAEPAAGDGDREGSAGATAVDSMDSMVADTAGLGITDVTPMFSMNLPPAVDQLHQAAASAPAPASALHADGLLIFGGADVGGNIFDDLMLLCPKKP